MSAPSTLSLLTIDLDDTLWPCEPTIRRAEEELYAWLQRKTPRLAAVHDSHSLRRHRQELARTRPQIAHDFTVLRLESLRSLLVDSGYDVGLAEEAVALFLRCRNRVEPYLEVVPVLRELGGGYRLVSVTNGNSDVARTPLRGLFHHCLTAADVGAQKPEPALFLSALRWAQVEPERALHLGDDPHRDVEAARRVGMGAVWVNRTGRSWPDELEPPDAEVADLNELRNWLGGAAGAL